MTILYWSLCVLTPHKEINKEKMSTPFQNEGEGDFRAKQFQSGRQCAPQKQWPTHLIIIFCVSVLGKPHVTREWLNGVNQSDKERVDT